MRTALRCLLAACVLLLTYGESTAFSVGELYRLCTSNDEAVTALCGMYMTGFMNGLNFEQIKPRKICLPQDITGVRVKQAFEGFMRDYPKLQNAAEINQVDMIVSLALVRAFPCPK